MTGLDLYQLVTQSLSQGTKRLHYHRLGREYQRTQWSNLFRAQLKSSSRGRGHLSLLAAMLTLKHVDRPCSSTDNLTVSFSTPQSRGHSSFDNVAFNFSIDSRDLPKYCLLLSMARLSRSLQLQQKRSSNHSLLVRFQRSDQKMCRTKMTLEPGS